MKQQQQFYRCVHWLFNGIFVLAKGGHFYFDHHCIKEPNIWCIKHSQKKLQHRQTLTSKIVSLSSLYLPHLDQKRKVKWCRGGECTVYCGICSIATERKMINCAVKMGQNFLRQLIWPWNYHPDQHSPWSSIDKCLHEITAEWIQMGSDICQSGFSHWPVY